MLFIEQCSGCHGTDLAGGRALSLFNEQWLASTFDERIANAIRNGVPNSLAGSSGSCQCGSWD
jgi:mono/diheme cytochrome c family protein